LISLSWKEEKHKCGEEISGFSRCGFYTVNRVATKPNMEEVLISPFFIECLFWDGYWVFTRDSFLHTAYMALAFQKFPGV
jgi:hypothetical protein